MTNTKPSTRIFFAFAFLSAISVLNFIAMESASAQGSERHILIALDDSGSMGNERFPAGRPGNDPYRLSRFATRALLALLPDDTLATVITMGNNGIDAARGVDPAPIPPLDRLRKAGERGNRDALEALLRAPSDESARGALTQHDLSQTPCQRVLDGMTRELNRAYQSGVVQTAFLLSDGRCTDRMQIDAFLSSLEAEKAAREFEREGGSGPRPFQFYFVCMGSEGCSPELSALAARTGGAAFRASSAAHQPQPAELIDIFGQVIGRSQGVCPIVYDASDERARLQRFPGSSGAQLLAVPEANESVKLAPPRGVPILAAREAEHHWEGRVFRFAAGLMPPLREAIRLPVESSGGARLLAIPRYDAIQLSMRLLEGTCEAYQRGYQADAPAFRPSSALPAGGTICVELALLGRDEQPIAREGMGRAISAAIELTRPGSTESEAISVLAERDTPIERFLYEIPNLAPGTISLAGRVELSPECLDRTIARPTGGEPTVMRAPRRSHEVSRVEFAVAGEADDEQKLHTLTPGSAIVVDRAFRFEGNFEPGAIIAIQRRDARPDEGHPHRCVELYYGDQRVPFANEPPIEIAGTVGSGSSLSLRAGAHCGFRGDESVREVPVSFRLVRSGVEALVMPRYQLINQVELARELDVALKAAGDHVDVAWGPESEASEASQRYAARLDLANASASLPKGLEIGFIRPETARAPRGDEAELLQEIEFTVRPGDEGAPLLVRARARRCCEAEALRVPIVLTAIDDDGGAGEPLSSILMVNVERDGFWSCYGPPILLAIYTLIALFILWMIWNFFTKIHLLPKTGGPSLYALTATNRPGKSREYDETPASTPYTYLSERLGSRAKRRLLIALANPVAILVRGKDGYETIHCVLNEHSMKINLERISPVRDISTDDDFDKKRKTTVTHEGERKRIQRPSISSGIYFRAKNGGRGANVYGVTLLASSPRFYVYRSSEDNTYELTHDLAEEEREQRENSDTEREITRGIRYDSMFRCVTITSDIRLIIEDYERADMNDNIGARFR